MIKAEWTNADALDLQPTCNKLATDSISRQAAIDAIMERFKRVPTNAIIAKDTIENLPSAQPTIEERKWIPCSERLPDNEKRVLCTVQSGEHFCVVPCIFIQHTRRWLPEVYGNHDCVIAWMPLPEPYTEETK